jgi:ribonuclease BN (tRNA processing enzyme)
VEFSDLAAAIEFIALEPGVPHEIAGATVTGLAQLHGGDSFGYRIEQAGRSLVYTTDAEYKPEDDDQMQRTVAFFRGADLVIFDSMYSLADSISVKEDWGHSSNVMGVELCQMAGVKQLCLFHHEPVNDDERIQDILNETLRFEELTRPGEPLGVQAAFDGLVIDI